MLGLKFNHVSKRGHGYDFRQTTKQAASMEWINNTQGSFCVCAQTTRDDVRMAGYKNWQEERKITEISHLDMEDSIEA